MQLSTAYDKSELSPELLRGLITLAVMLVTVMEVLDMTIVNVSLPPMMGALGANSDQITWILTSYIVSAAILMPLTGALVKQFGRRKLLLMNIMGFLVASILCGVATNLPEMVFFRSLQGVFGAALVPLSQYILREVYPPEEQGKAMALWGIGVMVAPVLGPTLGGYITENFNWRWVFYINVPISLLALFLCWQLIDDTPIQKVKWDKIGLVSMVLGIACLQIVLDRGTTDDWFSSPLICALSLIALTSLVIFIYHGLTSPRSLINLRLFLDRNFGLCSLLLLLYCSQTIGLISIQPFMLEHVMGYDTGTTGTIMAPRGIASAISMAIVAKIGHRVDGRILLLFGLGIAGCGTYGMSTFSFSPGMFYLILMSTIQGLGMGLFFVPLSTMAFNTLNPTEIAEASGLFSFNRSLGCSIGISVLMTLLTHERQLNWQRLSSHIRLTHPNYTYWMQHTSFVDPSQALVHLGQVLNHQATMAGFLDIYYAGTISFIVMVPFILLLKPYRMKK